MSTIKCRFGFHDWIELPKPKQKMLRMFVIRRVRGCLRCGLRRVNNFSNGIAGGGTVDSRMSAEELALLVEANKKQA